MALPDELRRRFEAVLALIATADKPDYNEVMALLGPAMSEAGFVVHDALAKGAPFPVPIKGRDVLRANELTPLQRDVAELLSSGPRLPLESYPLPSQGWARRQWLGHAPGPLFVARDNGRTLYEELRALTAFEADRRRALFDALPPRERLAALADFDLLVHDRLVDVEWPQGFKVGEQLDDTYGAWGADLAERLILHDFRTSPFEACHFPTSPLPHAALLAMVRGNITLEPRFDRILVLNPWTPLAEKREILDAIPSDRREEALLAGIGQALFPATV